MNIEFKNALKETSDFDNDEVAIRILIKEVFFILEIIDIAKKLNIKMTNHIPMSIFFML